MIIITGASQGIGKYLFSYFTSEGRDVVGIYNNTKPDSNEDVFYKVNICSKDEVNDFVDKIRHKLNYVVLINCASINYNCFFHKADPDKWAEVIGVNLLGTFNMIHAMIPYMREQNYGRIINFSSVVAQIGIPGTSAYAASKSGLWGLTKAIAIENSSKGITVNNLNLGYFQIGMIDQVPSNIQDQIKERIPMNRFGDPNEIVLAVNYLIESSYITGTCIDINGGLY